MNKSDLIKALSKEMDLPIRKAEEIVDMVFDTMSKSLVSGDRIEIRGFGSFTVRQYRGIHGPEPQDRRKKGSGGKEASVFQGGTGPQGRPQSAS